LADPARTVLRTLAAYSVRLPLAFVAGVVLSRALQPEGRGTYYLLVTIAGTAQALGHLSVEKAQIAFWPIASRRALAANSVLLGLVLGLAAAALAAGAVVIGGGAVPGGAALLLVALAGVPAGILVINLTNLATLQSRIGAVNLGTLTGAVVQCGTLLALGALGLLSVGWVVVMWTVSTAVPLLFLARGIDPRACDPRLAVRSVGVGVRYHLGLLSLRLLLRADILILGALATTRAVGLYSLAVTLMELSRIPPDAVRQVVLGRQASADAAEAAALTVRSTRLSVLVGLGSVGLICAAAPVLIPLAYGRAFAPSVLPLLLLAPGLIALNATRPLESYLLRLDRPMALTAVSMAALAVNVVLNLLLIPGLGAAGCALASSAGYALLAGLQAVWFLRVSAQRARSLLPGRAELRRLQDAAPGRVLVPQR
jgi:O-antigen/teichoic acid export membrane protein